MAKTKISEFSATPGNNTDIDGINIAEGCAPSGINDAIRELMSQLKDFQAGTAGDSFNGPVGTTTAADGAFITLTTSSTVTHNGGTANGVAYLNGSKVLTTGSALTFDGTNLFVGATSSAAGKLVVKDTASSNTLWLVGRASDGTSSISFRNAADSAYNARLEAVSGQLAFEVNGSEGMRLTSTGLELKGKLAAGYSDFSGIPTNGAAFAGSVGIGTSSPAYKLDVQTANSSNPDGITVRSTSSSSSAGAQLVLNGYGNSWGIVCGSTAKNSNALTFSLDALGTPSEKMRLDSSGNLGLGVTPSAWTGLGVAFETTGGALLGQGTNNISLYQNAYYSTGFKYKTTNPASSYEQTAGSHRWFTAPSGTAGNAISFTQAMTLTAAGDLGVGSTSPSARLELAGVSSPQIALNGSANTGYRGISFQYSGTQYGFAGLNVQNGEFLIRSGESGQSGYYLAFQTNGSERARITSEGRLGVGTTSPNALLDVRDPSGSARLDVHTSGSGGVLSTFVAERNGGLRISSESSAGWLAFNTGTAGTTERIRITSSGAVSFGSGGTNTGTSNQVLFSNGSGSAPTWKFPILGAAETTTNWGYGDLPTGRGWPWKGALFHTGYVAQGATTAVLNIYNEPNGLFMIEMTRADNSTGPYGNISGGGGMELHLVQTAHHGWSNGSSVLIASSGTLHGSYTTSNWYQISVTGGTGGTYYRIMWAN